MNLNSAGWRRAALACLALAVGLSAGSDIPQYFTAVDYNFTLNLDLDNTTAGTFLGAADLTLKTNGEVPLDVKDFVVNGARLEPKQVKIMYPNMGRWDVPVISIKRDQTLETMTIPGRQPLANNSVYHLWILYEGNLNSTNGLFRSTMDSSNYLGVKLYPSYGRRVFPCLDYPGNMVNVTLNLNIKYSGKSEPVIATGLQYISKSNVNGKLKASYKSPIPIPLNALFFTIGAYTQVNPRLPLWTPPSLKNKVDQVAMALETPTMKELYTSIGMSPGAVVIPGLPSEAESGLAITAFSPSLGVDSDSSSSWEERKNTILIMKALAKSLFSTVISPQNWNDIWIAESIPAYIGEAVYTETSRWRDFKGMGLGLVERALDSTWSEDSWPVWVDFKNVSQVLEYLGSPSVDKGAAILGMLENLLPDASKLKTFSKYLAQNKGKAVSTDDFLDSYSYTNGLNSSQALPTGKSLKELVKPWLTEKGYPAVVLTRVQEGVVTATEERYWSGGSDKPNNAPGWTVPILFMPVSNTSGANDDLMSVWLLPGPNSNIELSTNRDPGSSIAVNVKGPGLYRTLYDESDLSIIGSLLMKPTTDIPPSVRATLLRDGLAFAKANRLKYSALLSMMEYLQYERELEPWTAAVEGLADLWSYLYFQDKDLVEAFEIYATNLLRYSYIELGLDLSDSSFKNSMLRSVVTAALCDYVDPQCSDDTKTAYSDYILAGKEENIFATDLISVVYCNGLRDAANTTTLTELLMKKYSPELPQSAKKEMFSYLACPQNNATITGLLKTLIVDGVKEMPAEDVISGFEAVASRPEHLDLAYSFLGANLNRLVKSLDDTHKAHMIQILGERGSTDGHLQMMNDFVSSTNNSIVQATISDALKTIQSRKKFVTDNYNEIVLGLYGHVPASGTTQTPSSSTPSGDPTPSPVGPTNGTLPTPSTTPSHASPLVVGSSLLTLASLAIGLAFIH